ncbi:MAG TPA: ATP-binding protein, partial [Burkholderiaceae bacterium]
GLRAALQPALGDRMPFIVAYPAIVLAASMWGIGAGLVVAAASIVAVVVPFVPPDMGVAEQPVHVGSFTLVAILICIAGSLRSRRAARDADDPPLTGWLRAVLWGAVLIPLLAFLSAAWWGYERAHEDAEATAARAAVLVRDHAQHTFDIAGTIARRADTIASGSDGEVRAHEAEIHRRLADMVLGLPSVVNLNVWDENGVALARSDRYPGGRVVPVADRAYFMAERPPGARPMISEVIHGRQTGRELMNLALRRGGDDPRFSGVVTVSMAPGFFRDYYRSLARDNPNLARFALVRTDGTVLAAWPPRPPGDDRLRPDDAILSRVRAGERTGRQLVTAERGGERRYVSFQRVGDYPLYVMAGVSRRAMLAGWLHFVGLLSALLLPVTAGLTYVSLVAIRKTRREQAIGVELAEAVRRRAAAERAAMESQKLETLAQLTGGVAHDFNNLLAIISSSLQVHLHLHPALAGERHLQAIARAVRSGTRLTRQLLSFSRRQALRPETIALQAWLPGAGDLLRSTVGSRVELAIAVAPDTRPVRVDLAELELSLINLALNARHAMPAGGALRIGARNEFDGGATRVVIAVSDTGVGIPADVLPRVFEPFYTTRSHESGSGLGLSQVHGFCAQAGGRVRIASEPGQGTTVEMLLPAEEATAPRANVQDDGPWERLAGRVMLVEDNGDVAASTAAILQAAGLEVTHMWSADTALAALQGGAPLPSLVLSDIEMPGRLSGLDLALRLRDRWPRLPVILVTGYATQLDEAVAAGLRVLPKPTAAGELLRVLRQALDAAPRASPDPVAAPS